MEFISLVVYLIAILSPGSVGIGTIGAAIFVGNEVKCMTKLFGESRNRLLHESDNSKVISRPLLNIMKKDVYTINENSTIANALKTMNEKKVSGLPVVDNNNQLVGFISDGDIIMELSNEHSLFINLDSLEKINFNSELNKILSQKVLTIAKKRVYTVDITDDLGEVCYKLTENKLKKAPVMQDGKMIGIINSSNIIKYAVSLINKK